MTYPSIGNIVQIWPITRVRQSLAHFFFTSMCEYMEMAEKMNTILEMRSTIKTSILTLLPISKNSGEPVYQQK